MGDDVLTTGQVAEMCNVSVRTVCNWADNLGLRSYRVPGSTHRRIQAKELVLFLESYGNPIPDELTRKELSNAEREGQRG